MTGKRQPLAPALASGGQRSRRRTQIANGTCTRTRGLAPHGPARPLVTNRL